jgi:Rrf2 family protein
MKLSQSAVYAIRVALLLADTEGAPPVPCGELAKKGSMPQRFLLQILRDLAKQRIVRPTRGGSGGFALERTPDKISLLELIEAIDGPLVPSPLVLGNLPAEVAQRVQQALTDVFEICRDRLRGIHLDDLLGRPGKPDGTAGPDGVL